MYNESEARRLVIEAGHRLLENRLIARTWGNISARVSDTEFVITPSGRAYDTLKPEELVKVNMLDLSYEGDVKPSSEKGIHAHAYILRKDVDFVIHTHQHYASAVAAEGLDVEGIPCAGYGLPGTGKLKSAVSLSIAMHPEAKAFLMAKHGALCLGSDIEDAFAVAEELEAKCRTIFTERVGDIRDFEAEYAKNHSFLPAYIDDYAQLVGVIAKLNYGVVKTPASDDPEAVEMIVQKNCAAALYVRASKPMGILDGALQRVVYLKKYSKQKNA